MSEIECFFQDVWAPIVDGLHSQRSGAVPGFLYHVVSVLQPLRIQEVSIKLS